MIRKLMNEEYITIDRSIIGEFAGELATVGELSRDVTAKCRGILELIKTGESLDGDKLSDDLLETKRDLFIILNRLDLLTNYID